MKHGMNIVKLGSAVLLACSVFAACATGGKVPVYPKDGENPDRLIKKAFQCYRNGDTRTAREIAAYCVRNNMRMADACQILGHSYYAEGDMKNAAVSYKMAIQNNRSLGECYTNLALINAKNGNVHDAMYILDAGAPYCQNNSMYYYVSGTINASVKNYRTAAHNFLNAISLNPMFQPAYNGLIYCYREMNLDKDVERVQKLWEKNTAYARKEQDRRKPGPEKDRALVEAARKNNYQKVMAALDSGADVNAASAEKIEKTVRMPGGSTEKMTFGGSNALHLAAASGNAAMVKLLIDRNADLNARDKSGWSALHHAAFNGFFDVVRLLVETGADIGVRDDDGQTPYMKSVIKGNEGIAKYLLDKGANLESPCDRRMTALNAAARYGHVSLVRFLLSSGANVNSINSDRETPLMSAAANGHVEIVRILIQSGAEINFQASDRRTALDKAFWSKDGARKDEIMRILKQAGGMYWTDM